MTRNIVLVGVWLGLAVLTAAPDQPSELQKTEALYVGFADADITPKTEGRTVYVAGFGQNRVATGVHDRLMARAVFLQSTANGGRKADGNSKKLALVSIDLVGFFHANVLNVRQQLPSFEYVLVSSTHNHEGPDTLGIWGPSAFKSGVDPEYLKLVEERIVKAVLDAEKSARPAAVRIGKIHAPELLHDGREPYVKHDELVALRFEESAAGRKPLGLLVQWNCHPETLGKKNTLLSADYVGYTVAHLRKAHDCPVAYFTGTVGGLMTSLDVPIKDEKGTDLKDGTYEKTERYGVLLGRTAEKALASATPLRLTPIEVRRQDVFVPMTNRLYLAARWMKVIEREGFLWTGDFHHAEPAALDVKDKPMCIRTEVALLRLGDLEVACIPGEIYPELVLGKVQEPADPGADFPDAPAEPAIYAQLKAPHRMLIGLANDEIGYILPKRQWDEKPPFCYGRKNAQYGEANSVGPDAGPILCRAFKELAERRGK